MHELSRLRRELIARLLASGIFASGILELIDVIMFGTPAQAQAMLARGELAPGDLKTLTKAMIDFSKQLRGTLNVATIIGNTRSILGSSEPRKEILNIGGFIGQHSVKQLRSAPQEGNLSIVLQMTGFAQSGLPQRFLSGVLFISNVAWTGVAQATTQLGNSSAELILKTDVYGKSSLGFSNPQCGELFFNIINPKAKGKTNIGIPRQAEEKIKIPIMANVSTINGIRGYSQISPGDISILSQQTKLCNAKKGQGLLDGVFPEMSGYIKLQITILVLGELLLINSWDAKPKVLTNTLNLTRDFFLGGLRGDSPITVAEAQFARSIQREALSIVPNYALANPLKKKGIFFLDEITADSVLQVKGIEEILPLNREFIATAFVINSLPSYQWRSGIYGRAEIDLPMFIDALPEHHKTLEYEIIPDEIYGGDTYLITTKYYKEANGIMEIGWRYVGYIIE